MTQHFQPVSPSVISADLTAEEVALIKGLVAPAVLTMLADGKVANPQRRELIGSLRFNGILARIGPEAVLAIFEQLLEQGASRFGAEALCGMAEAMGAPQRETALCIAVRIAYATGSITPDEETLLSELTSRLGVPFDTYTRMIEVMSILQRPA